MTAPTPIAVAVLDDQEFICQAVLAIASMSDGRIDVTLTTSHRQDFLDHVLADRPDVSLVDLMMEDRISGHEVIAALAKSSLRALAFTADRRRLPIGLAMKAGARGLVLKSDPADVLIRAIISVHEEGWAPSSEAAGVLLDDSTSLPTLSPHELKCLRLAAEGVPIKAIGRQFTPAISLSSVKTYLARAYEKYSEVGRPVHNTTEAVVSTVHDGWFDL